ncbi:enoyl-[acyl-carrier-protein] reductase [NADH] [Planotetraspora silvatica]|uniref:trans-2-enoyl-CoA reductase (NAD(+)) n=1 Tax=Planotetraspora silvatica TaxID=234614 RepID=A0A8J3UJR4_9ACTN|nr:enoyl-[acyl-carrier-protein] reductase FabV [Planotetraspora silvatica]GII45761.1 enoyl-[acyl-carrier-protein] reductase [NADH] [Planotetraspora silvatica]
MTARLIQPSGRGFLLFDSHPDGCARIVTDMAAKAQPVTRPNGERPVALIIGSSAGYGLAAAVAGISRYGVQGVGLCFERPPTGRRTATAGWYRTIATAKLAEEAGSDFAFLNGDAFADTTKDDVLDLIAKRFGGIDHLIYSVAAPRRTDPRTGVTHQSVIQPIGAEHVTKTLEFDKDGTPRLREIGVQPAGDEETADTVKVMGGEDWSLWIDALDARGLIRQGFTTVALSYIGSHLTSAIYRAGTIGRAKLHLESTASALGDRLSAYDGRALTSVNGAAVTQASTAIPGIALYVSLLRGVLGEGMRSPLAQSVDLWDQLTGAAPLGVDEQGRIRLDRWELEEKVQASVTERWKTATPETIGDLADIDWFRDEVRRLYGFDVAGVHYSQPCEPDLPWPAA